MDTTDAIYWLELDSAPSISIGRKVAASAAITPSSGSSRTNLGSRSHLWIRLAFIVTPRYLGHRYVRRTRLQADRSLLLIRPETLLLTLLARDNTPQDVHYQWWTLSAQSISSQSSHTGRLPCQCRPSIRFQTLCAALRGAHRGGCNRNSPGKKALLGPTLLGPRIFLHDKWQRYRPACTSVPRTARERCYRRQSVVVHYFANFQNDGCSAWFCCKPMRKCGLVSWKIILFISDSSGRDDA